MTAALSKESSWPQRTGEDAKGAEALPAAAEVLEQILDALPVADIGHLQQVSRPIQAVARDGRAQVLLRRGFDEGWSWRKAHATEAALFMDMLGVGSQQWSPGPNENVECNVMEQDSDAGSWLWLSGGTDWQGFQGGFRCVSGEGIRPTWVTFRIRIRTPALSGAFLTLSPAQRTWGLADPILTFNYSGDERASQTRCFVVQTGSTQKGDKNYICRVKPEITMDRPYEVAVHLDWRTSAMSVFIDGEQHVHRAPFRATEPVRFAALYNWRSGAWTAFSELMLGDVCPYTLHNAPGTLFKPTAKLSSRSASASSFLSCQCRKRNSNSTTPKAIGSTVVPLAWALTTTAVALFAVAVQQAYVP